MSRSLIYGILFSAFLAGLTKLAPAAPAPVGNVQGVTLRFIDADDGRPLRVFVRAIAKGCEAERYYGLEAPSLILKMGTTRVADLADDAAVAKRFAEALQAHEPLDVESGYDFVVFRTLPEPKNGPPLIVPQKAGPMARPFAVYEQELKKAGIDKLWAALTSNNANDAGQARTEAEKSLAHLGARAADAQRALNSMLTDTALDAGLAYTAAFALALTFGDADAGINRLLTALRDPLYTLRESAADSLTKYPERAADRAVPELLALVEDPGYLGLPVANSAAAALGSFGQRARPAVPTLLKTLKTQDNAASLRAAAFSSLAAIAPESGPEAIRIVLADKELFQTNSVLANIPQFGPAARAALPALKAMAKSDREPECFTAANAVKEIEKTAAGGK